MKFIVSKTTLADALGITGKAVTPSNIIPLLGNYLFHIKDGSLLITGSNLQLFITKQIGIESKDLDIQVAIPAKRLYDLVKELDEQPLQFLIEEASGTYRITLSAASGTYAFSAEDGKDYPNLKNAKEVSFTMESAELLAGINKTLFACSADELRPAMTGVLVSFVAGQVTYTATNAAMLSTHSYAADVDAKFSFIVPAKILAIVQSMSTHKPVNIHIDKKSIVLHIDENTILKSRLIDEKYVDYVAAIPKDNPNRFTAAKAELMGSLRRITQFAEGNNHKVILEVDELNCSLKTENSLGETAFEQIKHTYTGTPVTIGIDGKNLLSCITKLDSEMIGISLSAPNRALLLREVGPEECEDTNLMLLMPLTV